MTLRSFDCIFLNLTEINGGGKLPSGYRALVSNNPSSFNLAMRPGCIPLSVSVCVLAPGFGALIGFILVKFHSYSAPENKATRAGKSA
jgi:hypothetical protein